MAETTLEAAPQTPHARTGAFEVTDWALLASIALMWGSSFVLIEVALESFAPLLITFLRIVFGAATLVWVKRARQPIERGDWGAIAVVGLLWMAIPFLLFPIAQQWIDSSLAGMINGSVPLFATLVATVVSRRLPRVVQAIGLAIGFGGVVAVSWPAVQDAKATATGALLVMLACVCYGIALNVMVPLQRKYGGLPVLLRVQAVAIAATIVPGIVGATQSTFSWASLAVMIPLGCLGTGMAFVAMTTLAGHVGAARASVTIYFVPVVAIVLGVLFQNETVAIISLVGTALVLFGAYLTSRAERT
jgi:drug/metabolite transporter (DMT)-like permease